MDREYQKGGDYMTDDQNVGADQQAASNETSPEVETMPQVDSVPEVKPESSLEYLIQSRDSEWKSAILDSLSKMIGEKSGFDDGINMFAERVFKEAAARGLNI